MSNTWGLTTRHLQLIAETLAQFPEVLEARIFGSRALGTFKPGSDVDLVLYGQGPLACATRISRILNEDLPLPHRFDVCDYATISDPDMKAHIDQFGQVLYRRA